MSELSKYASNQFLIATVDRFPLVSELFSDIKPKISAAATANADFAAANDGIIDASTDWDGGEILLTNAEAFQRGATETFINKMDSLTRKPDPNTNSPIAQWDLIIQTAVAYQSPPYTILLPQGRETLTGGTLEQQLTAGHAFALRLDQQGTLLGKPALNTLSTAVAVFYDTAENLRTDQGTAETATDNARTAQEVLRVGACAAFISMVGTGLQVWKDDVAQVDTLFDVNMLRSSPQEVPAAPADSLWTPATKTLSTSALPAGATRVQLWRQGPGGAPELLAVGLPGQLAIAVPAEYTFDVGDLYQLWFQGLNSRGTSLPGPKQPWTAT